MREFRVFNSYLQTKNAVIVKSIPTDPAYPALIPENLINNTDNRSTDRTLKAYDRSRNDINGVEYCYMVRAYEVYIGNKGIYELTLKLQ